MEVCLSTPLNASVSLMADTDPQDMTQQHPYSDTPTSPSTTKPPTEPYNDHDHDHHDPPLQPYRDDATSQPLTPYYDIAPSTTSPTQTPLHPHDPSLPPQYTDDDVPLALLLHPLTLLFHPLEAPPSYAVATSSSYRDALIQYVPARSADADEEAGEEERPDNVRFDVERLFAAFIVTVLLMVVAGVMLWLTIGSGML